jgi:hypothetical protein
MEAERMTYSEVIQLIQVLASVATVFLVILTWQQIRLVRKQAMTTFEDGLSAQYRRLMENIPTEIWLSAELTALDNSRKEACRDAIYRYLDLSNEQAFLHCKKRVTDDTWTQWKEGIEGNLQLPAFRAVWADVARSCPNSFKELRKLSPPLELSPPKNPTSSGH